MSKNIVKISLVLLVFCLLVVPVFAVTMVQYDDSYIQGGDYSTEQLTADKGISYCREKCLNDASCKAATYVPPGIIGTGESAYCFLKNINGPVLTAKGDILWLKMEDSVVSISSNPTGAMIYLDGVNTGYITPHTFRGLPAGEPKFRLVLAGYEDYMTSCYSSPGGNCENHANLIPARPATGSMAVVSVPSGATVVIDGYSQGPAPVTVTDLSAGTHAVRITMAGYVDYEGAWSVNSGQTTQVTVTLTPNPSATTTTGSGTGTIQVRSEPSGASVNLDGWDKGTTPVNFPDISTGNHVLMLTLAGYSDWKKTVTVYSGQTITVNADMGKSASAGTGTLSVTTTPAGAQVLVDGIPIGNSPMKSSGLTPGSHTLLLKMDGYKDLSIPITITAGQTTEYSTSLVPTSGTGMKTPGFAAILGTLAVVISIGVWKKRGH